MLIRRIGKKCCTSQPTVPPVQLTDSVFEFNPCVATAQRVARRGQTVPRGQFANSCFDRFPDISSRKFANLFLVRFNKLLRRLGLILVLYAAV